MPDMLVKLYDLQKTQVFRRMIENNINIRPALAPEKRVVCEWVEKHFGIGWASEADVAFSRQPVSIFVATKNGTFVGFACYDATCRGFFGPTGVDENQRGKGIGEALLFRCLTNMRDVGYGYAVIGGAGPTKFYELKTGAIAIENSVPGIYADIIKE